MCHLVLPTPVFSVILALAQGNRAAFPKVRLVLLIEAGTHLITDALICPYRMGERRRALKLVRSIGANTLLMWDRGLHSFRMVQATLAQGGHYLGRVCLLMSSLKWNSNCLTGLIECWIYPDRKSKQKGATQIGVRVIEYSIEMPGQLEPSTYRLITSFLDYEQFLFFAISSRISSTLGSGKYD